MWVTKLLISPVKKRIFCPKTTQFGPKLAFLSIWARPCRLIQFPVGGSVGGCGARAVSRKTPIYFISIFILGRPVHEITTNPPFALSLLSAPPSQLLPSRASRRILSCGRKSSFLAFFLTTVLSLATMELT